MQCLYIQRNTIFNRLQGQFGIGAQIYKSFPQLLTHFDDVLAMNSHGQVLISHFLQLCFDSSLEGAEVDTWWFIDMFDGFHYELYLFRKRFILFIVHFVLIDEIQHHHLACQHCIFYFIFLLLFLQFTFQVELPHLLRSLRIDYLPQFGFLGLSSFSITLFFQLGIVQISLQFCYFVLMFLCSGFVFFTTLPLIVNELIHSFFKNVEKRIKFVLFLLFGLQHYNPLILLLILIGQQSDQEVFKVLVNCLRLFDELIYVQIKQLSMH